MQEVSLTNTVKSLSQQEHYLLIEVIALTLRYLKNKLLSLEELARGLTGAMKASDFNWVITVPAMWKARGKQMMREAAYLVSKLILYCEANNTFYSYHMLTNQE